jgi:endoglucanase
MKKNSFLFLLFFALSVQGQQYIRFNQVGYSPERPKRAIVMSNENATGWDWTITDQNKHIVLSGKLGPSISGKGMHTSHPYNYEIIFSELKTLGQYQLSMNKGEPVNIVIKQDPYAFITSDIIRYLRVQRSGTALSLDHKASHVGDSSCAIMTKETESNESWKLNANASNVNMLGGWYDAGDYLKFTLTIAYTTHQLLHAYTINPALFNQKKYSKSQYNDLLDEAKWGLDYLCRTMPNDKTFVIEVGGAEDHKQGNRLPDQDPLNGKRNAYADFSPTQMGYTAAALALGAQVFDSITHPALHQRYKTEAIKIYEKALQYTTPSWVKDGWESFYGDEKVYDNMQLAATELYRLTQYPTYLKQAKAFSDQSKEGYWYSWGDANLLAHNRLYPFANTTGSYIFADLYHFETYANKAGNIWKLPHEYTWASLYSLMGVANNGLLYDRNTQKTDYKQMGYDVLDYTLGMNNWGIAMVCSKDIPHAIRNVYSQVYKLQPSLYPTGAVAEGPGDRETHEELKQYFEIPPENSFEAFNTEKVVFYDLNTNFQTMETTIVGLSDALLLFTLVASEK